MPDDYDYRMINGDTLDRITKYLQERLDFLNGRENAEEIAQLLKDIEEDQEHYADLLDEYGHLDTSYPRETHRNS